MTVSGIPACVTTLTLEHVGVDLGGICVLDDINLTVDAGVPVGLTGPSGSGKTILCLVLAGALAPSRGRILLDGRAFVSDRTTPVGLILQTHGLVEGLTAQENVALVLQARRLSGVDIAARAEGALHSVGLGDHGSRSVDQLSGGERQRVGIARALAGDPAVLIADEPTSELDPANRHNVLELLKALAATARIVVMASDDPGVVGALPRVVELDGGRITAPR